VNGILGRLRARRQERKRREEEFEAALARAHADVDRIESELQRLREQLDAWTEGTA
jgi:exonuclease VII small subunit